MNLKKIALLGLLGLGAGALIAFGIRIKVHYVGSEGHFDEEYIEGKFYRRPVHPGFITQRHPKLKTTIINSRGRHSGGLPTAERYEEE